MNIIMTVMDYEHADISIREQMSFVQGQVSKIVSDISKLQYVSGCILLSTCNRTELYLSLQDDVTVNPAEILCNLIDAPFDKFKNVFITKQRKQAIDHIFEVACGLRSQILGEDQIVTQVKNAATIARKEQALDATLETMFRFAVTAGKEVKTNTRLTAVPLSAAHRGVTLINEKMGSLSGKNVVVIGNGEMGRLAASLLVDQGANVTVTLRSYRHGETIIPRGCSTKAYDERMEIIDGADLVVSATTSPHYTLTKEKIESMQNKPEYILDLALPRDIDPEISDIATVLNMDDLGKIGTENKQDMEKVYGIIEKQQEKFYGWVDYRDSLPIIEQIKQTAFNRSFTGECDEDAVRLAVEKTVDMLLGGMKESITPEILRKTLGKMQKNTVVTEKIGER